MSTAHAASAPSPWLVRWSHLLPRHNAVLDLACGSGRHTRWLASRGHRVVAVDRDAEALAALDGVSGVQTVHADLEGAPWPFAGERFAAIVVTNYLHRPLFASIAAAIDAHGVLVYETFMSGNEVYGRPSSPAFLLRPGELLEVFSPTLVPIAFQQGLIERPVRAVVQRFCGTRADVRMMPLIAATGPASRPDR